MISTGPSSFLIELLPSILVKTRYYLGLRNRGDILRRMTSGGGEGISVKEGVRQRSVRNTRDRKRRQGEEKNWRQEGKEEEYLRQKEDKDKEE